MNKTLLLVKNTALYFFPAITEFDVSAVLKQTDDAYFDAIEQKKDQPLASLDYSLGSWIHHVQDYDTIIFLDYGFQPWMAHAVRSKTTARIIFYIWNLIDSEKLRVISTLQSNQWVDDIYTFTPQDARSYTLKYNSTFYKHSHDTYPSFTEYDVFFGGKNGGRESRILSLMNHFEDHGLRTLIHAIDFETIPAAPYIPYPEYIKLFLNSKAILEVLKETQQGITLRSMESIFYHRKLITTNISIRAYQFYNPQNIFILDHDDEDSLLDFLNSPYHPVPEDIIAYYQPDQWLERFSQNQEEIFRQQFISDLP